VDSARWDFDFAAGSEHEDADLADSLFDHAAGEAVIAEEKLPAQGLLLEAGPAPPRAQGVGGNEVELDEGAVGPQRSTSRIPEQAGVASE
jgi:hypothetical protein